MTTVDKILKGVTKPQEAFNLITNCFYLNGCMEWERPDFGDEAFEKIVELILKSKRGQKNKTI